jgi:hypothetical protein
MVKLSNIDSEHLIGTWPPKDHIIIYRSYVRLIVHHGTAVAITVEHLSGVHDRRTGVGLPQRRSIDQFYDCLFGTTSPHHGFAK